MAAGSLVIQVKSYMYCDVPAHQICVGKYIAWHVAGSGCCGVENTVMKQQQLEGHVLIKRAPLYLLLHLHIICLSVTTLLRSKTPNSLLRFQG